MEWLDRLFRRAAKLALDGSSYRTACTLYSEDGERAVEIREFSNRKTYLVESEWVEGTTFTDRRSGSMVGPFKSPAHAERFITSTAWFRGQTR
ncbi:hypothetical protein [Phenylobacterium sp. Root700]|uniref:hypothetical protein n=1 Tax=Phenylobacterium sp. Root700 TaxID=1736591 RepID=UPI000713B0F2|nr:hypothetical protein [Phenylobacterium sp. Root700]KRB49515.1 hypothetical protein ASE02_17030 [Phenylobacterium sp. Root700]